MATLNVWLGVRTQDLPSCDGTETLPSMKPPMADRAVVAPMFRPDTQGATTREMRIMYVEDIPGWKGSLLQGFPQARILGAWTMDGELIGPLSNRILEYMHDDVTTDPNTGEETGRSRPTAPKQVNLGMGWADRRWVADPPETPDV